MASANVSVAKLSEFLNSETVEGPIRVQIIKKWSEVFDKKPLFFIRVCDYDSCADLRIGPTIKPSTEEWSQLVPFNLIDIENIEKSGNTYELVEFDNVEICDKQVCGFADVSVNDPTTKKMQGKNNKQPSEAVGRFVEDRVCEIVHIDEYSGSSFMAVRGIVVSKSKARNVIGSRDGSRLDVFSFIINDGTGDIQITVWNEVAMKLFQEIEVKKGYYIQGFDVKTVKNRTYNTTGHTYELTLNANSFVREDAVARSLVVKVKPLTLISKLCEADDNSIVCIRGILLEVGSRDAVRTKNGVVTIRMIIVVDMSSHSVAVKLWDTFADMKMNIGNAMLFNNVRVSRIGGIHLSTVGSSSVESANPPDLMGWWGGIGRTSGFTPIRSVFDRKLCDKAVTCMTVSYWQENKSSPGVEYYNGLYRLMKVGRLSTFIRCEQCLNTSSIKPGDQKQLICTVCKRSAKPNDLQFAITLTFGDHSGEIEVPAYSNVLRPLYESSTGKDDTNGDANLRFLMQKLFMHFHVSMKLDVNKNRKPRLTITELIEGDVGVVPYYYRTIEKREVVDDASIGKFHVNYWKKGGGHAIMPVRIYDLVRDDVNDYLSHLKASMLVFVGRYNGMTTDGMIRTFLFENELQIELSDFSRKVELADDDMCKVVEVVVRKAYISDEGVYEPRLMSAKVVGEDYLEVFEQNRIIIHNHCGILENVYGRYVDEDDDDVFVDNSLSPKMASMRFDGEPSFKKRAH